MRFANKVLLLCAWEGAKCSRAITACVYISFDEWEKMGVEWGGDWLRVWGVEHVNIVYHITKKIKKANLKQPVKNHWT